MDKTCDEYSFWAEEACMCFVSAQCYIGCPDGMNDPTKACECMSECAYQELFVTEPVCECIEDLKCGSVCQDKACDMDHYYDFETCQCFVKYQCEMACPEGEDMMPTEFCQCVP